MDTHTLPAQDLHPSGALSYDTDELEHENAAAIPRNAHDPGPHPSGGQAEREAEATSLPRADGLEPEAAQPLSMPGEHEAEAGNPSSPAAPVLAAQPSTRNLLLGTALALTMMVGGGGVYILSHHGHATRTAAMPPPAWHPEQSAGNPADPVAALATNPYRPPAQGNNQARGETDDILAMRHGSAGQPTIAAGPVPKAAPTVVVAPAVPVIAAPPPPVIAASPPRLDPVATALALRPAPMTPQQQVDVLSLVTELAALVRDMRTENAQLRDKVASLDTTVKNETSDISQRLNLMEARKAVTSAQEAGKPQPLTGPGGEAAAPAEGARSVPAVPVQVVVRTVRDYRVQAASPGLAILADADAAPGQSAGLQVVVGDQVPGVGRIISIGQRGTAWVVQTNHGTIQ